VAAIFLVFRFQVKSIPVQVLWIYRNGSALLLPAKEDLGGVFLEIKNMRGKVIQTIMKSGLAIEVAKIDQKRGYLVQSEKSYKSVKKGRFGREKVADKEEGQLEDEHHNEKGEEKRTVRYLDVALGGLKHMRLYVVREGTGDTIDMVNVGEKGSTGMDPGNATVMHEERGAAKEFLKMLAEAAAGTWKTIIIPMLAGAGLGSAVVTLLLILFGHLK
jgi:hypothetical protein